MCKDQIVGQTTWITRHFTLELRGLFHERARGGCLPPVVALGQCVLATAQPAKSVLQRNGGLGASRRA